EPRRAPWREAPYTPRSDEAPLPHRRARSPRLHAPRAHLCELLLDVVPLALPRREDLARDVEAGARPALRAVLSARGADARRVHQARADPLDARRSPAKGVDDAPLGAPGQGRADRLGRR